MALHYIAIRDLFSVAPNSPFPCLLIELKPHTHTLSWNLPLVTNSGWLGDNKGLFSTFNRFPSKITVDIWRSTLGCIYLCYQLFSIGSRSYKFGRLQDWLCLTKINPYAQKCYILGGYASLPFAKSQALTVLLLKLIYCTNCNFSYVISGGKLMSKYISWFHLLPHCHGLLQKVYKCLF